MAASYAVKERTITLEANTTRARPRRQAPPVAIPLERKKHMVLCNTSLRHTNETRPTISIPIGYNGSEGGGYNCVTGMYMMVCMYAKWAKNQSTSPVSLNLEHLLIERYK